MELEKILKQSVEKTQQAAALIDEWANGDEQHMVSGRSGAYPSAKRATQEIQKRIQQTVQHHVTSLQASVNKAKTYAELAEKKAEALAARREQAARHLPFDGVVGASLDMTIIEPNQLSFPHQSFHFQGQLYDLQQSLTLPDPEYTAGKAFAVDYVLLVFNHGDDDVQTTHYWEVVRGYPTLSIDQLDWQASPDDPAVFYGDNQTAFLLVKVVRRNRGAYHPISNPDGCAAFTGGKQWYQVSSTLDPFTHNQSVIDGLSRSARPDQLTANLVMPYDLIPCYSLAEAMVAAQDTRQQAFNVVLTDPRRWSLSGTHTTQAQMQFMLHDGELVTQHPELPYTINPLRVKLIEMGGARFKVAASSNTHRLTLIDQALLRQSSRRFGSGKQLTDGVTLYNEIPRSTITICYEAPNQRPVNCQWDIVGSPTIPPNEMANHPWLTEGLPGSVISSNIDEHTVVFNGNAVDITLNHLPTDAGLLQVLKSSDGRQWQDVTPAYAALYEKGQLAKARFEAHPDLILQKGDQLLIAYNTPAPLGQSLAPTVLSQLQLIDVSPVYFYSTHPQQQATDDVYHLFNGLVGQLPTLDPPHESPLINAVSVSQQQAVLSFPSALVPDTVMDALPNDLVNTDAVRLLFKDNQCHHAPLIDYLSLSSVRQLPRHAIKCVVALYRHQAQLVLGIHYKTLKRKQNKWGDNDALPIIPFDDEPDDLNKKPIKTGSRFFVLPVKYTERF